MIVDYLHALLHYLGILGMAFVLASEWVALRRTVDAPATRLLVRLDGAGLLFWTLTVVGGFGRVFYGIKGETFYLPNHVFWLKLLLVGLILLLAVIPSLKFRSWSREARTDPGFIADSFGVGRARRYVTAQIHTLVVVIPVASAVARGWGLG